MLNLNIQLKDAYEDSREEKLLQPLKEKLNQTFYNTNGTSKPFRQLIELKRAEIDPITHEGYPGGF